MEHHNHHHRRHHHQRDDSDEDRQSFGGPPPRNNFPDAPPQPHGLYQPQPPFDPYAPPPHFGAPSPPPHFGAPAPPPYFGAPAPPPHFGAPAPPPYFDAPAPPPHFGVPAPPPYFDAPAPPPPFGHVSHVGHHSSNESYPPDHHRYGARPPPDSMVESHTGVAHVAHHSSQGPQPYPPSGFDQRPDEKNRVPDNIAGLAGRATVKVYSKAEPNYYLTIRDGKVILAPANPSDEAQHWYKDEKYSTRVKDADGHPCFALVNKATGEAMKHSVGATHPVHLIRYDPDRLDESVLWTESKDLGDGYRTIRMINNTRLIVDAFHGDSKSGGVRDGTTIVLWDWNKGDNQRWKIFPFCKPLLNLSEIALLRSIQRQL